MTSHELARELLKGPELEICVLSIEKKRMLKPVTLLSTFDAVKTVEQRIAILTDGQSVNGNLYYLGDQPYVPEGAIYSPTAVRK